MITYLRFRKKKDVKSFWRRRDEIGFLELKMASRVHREISFRSDCYRNCLGSDYFIIAGFCNSTRKIWVEAMKHFTFSSTTGVTNASGIYPKYLTKMGDVEIVNIKHFKYPGISYNKFTIGDKKNIERSFSVPFL